MHPQTTFAFAAPARRLVYAEARGVFGGPPGASTWAVAAVYEQDAAGAFHAHGDPFVDLGTGEGETSPEARRRVLASPSVQAALAVRLRERVTVYGPFEMFAVELDAHPGIRVVLEGEMGEDGRGALLAVNGVPWPEASAELDLVGLPGGVDAHALRDAWERAYREGMTRMS